MFFKTAEEKGIAKIYGITEALGVTLLNHNHPFPIMVEEEERIHGALIANTTNGALFRTLHLMSIVPSETTKMILRLPIDIYSNQRLPALKVLNTIQFIRDEMRLNLIQCHEGFAKHIAYSLQFETIVEDNDRLEIEKSLYNDCKNYSILNELCHNFIHPRDKSAYVLASTLGYKIAKIILNTDSLSKLLLCNTSLKLWNRLKKGKLDSDLEARSTIGINFLKELVSSYNNTLELLLDIKFHGEKMCFIVAQRLNAAGFVTPELQDPTWLLANTHLLGQRIERLSRGVYFSDRDSQFVGFTTSLDTMVEIDSRFINENGDLQFGDIRSAILNVIRADPALMVFYPPLDLGKEGWVEFDTDPLQPSQWDKLAICVTPAFGANSEPMKQFNSSTNTYTSLVHLLCFGLFNNRAKSGVICNVDWYEQEVKLASFSRGDIVIVTREPYYEGLFINQAPDDELADILGKYAPVVFWNLVADPERYLNENSYFYTSEINQSPNFARNRGKMGLIDRVGKHTKLSCVPKYVIELVEPLLRRYFDDFKGVTTISDQDSWAEGAKLAYNLLYKESILPCQLPYFRGTDLLHFLSSDPRYSLMR
jgi:hypothetical protein